jgi:hypothetical protein
VRVLKVVPGRARGSLLAEVPAVAAPASALAAVLEAAFTALSAALKSA